MKHEIEIEGLPEGWEAVAFRAPSTNEYYFEHGVIVRGNTPYAKLIVKKKQPRRIVLEEDINDNRNPSTAQTLKLSSGRIMHIFCPYAVREVKETDIPLTNDDDNESLRLSVDECKEAMRKLETFNVTDLSVKICRFLKDK